jgi:hypothetical protein
MEATVTPAGGATPLAKAPGAHQALPQDRHTPAIARAGAKVLGIPLIAADASCRLGGWA